MPPEGWGLRDVRAAAPNQRRARSLGAGIGAARGQFSITRSPEPAGKKEAERAEGALPAAGPGHRAPGRGPFPPAARASCFVCPRLGVEGGSCRALRREGGGRKRDRSHRGRAGTQESGRGRGPRDDPEERAGAPPRTPGGGPGTPVSTDLPVDGGRCSSAPPGSSSRRGIPPLGAGPPQWATPKAAPWRLCVLLPAWQCPLPRGGLPARLRPGSRVGGPQSSPHCACVPSPSTPMPIPRRPPWTRGLESWRRGPRCLWTPGPRHAQAAGPRTARSTSGARPGGRAT